MNREASCADRVQAEWEKERETLTKLWDLYCEDSEAYDEDLGNLYEYGLSFDYVAPGTFTDQEQGYFRYQLSWGGPSDEIRFFVNPDLSMYHAEYWYLDWFDGAMVEVGREEIVRNLWDWFEESGTAEYRLEEAQP